MLLTRMNGLDEIVETGDLESHYGIKPLTCLVSSDDPDGTPISNTESLRRHLPARVFGIIQTIDNSTRQFSISFLNDSRNYSYFKHTLNQYYMDPSNCSDIERGNIEVGGLYVARIGKEFFRCNLLEINEIHYIVSLIDVGKNEKINKKNLFPIEYEFHGGAYNYAFALRCCTPEGDYLNDLRLPSLDDFCVGDVVDVVICSLREPCLTIIASTNRHFSRLHPAYFTEGFDESSISIWQSNFLNAYPSFEGITVGQYPAAQPTVSDTWILSTIAACDSLNSVYVRDISCSIRLSVLQEMVDELYTPDTCRLRMQFPDNVPLCQDLPCVIFDPFSKQYLRARITRLSGDRTVADVVCVDHPNISFRGVNRNDLYMLSEKFFVPQQCFSIQLVDIDDRTKLHQLTILAKHFLDVGSVVAVSLSSKSTIASLKVDDDVDIFTKINLNVKDNIIEKNQSATAQSSDSSSPEEKSLPSPAAYKSVGTFTFSYENSVTSEKENVPVVSQDLPSEAYSKYKDSNGKSILKSVTKLPFNAIEAIVVTVCNLNAIYYRNKESAKNFALLLNAFKDLSPDELIPLNESHMKNIKPGDTYLLSSLTGYRLLSRVKILSLGKNDDDVVINYEKIDSGEKSVLFEESEKLFHIPSSINELPGPTLAGPCRLAWNPDCRLSKAEYEKCANDMRWVAKLRLLLKNVKKCFLVESDNGLTLYKPSGVSINKEYFSSLRKFLDDENSDRGL